MIGKIITFVAGIITGFLLGTFMGETIRAFIFNKITQGGA